MLTEIQSNTINYFSAGVALILLFYCIRNSKKLAPILLFVFTVGLVFLYHAAPGFFNFIEPFLLFVGFFSVGIPHGALDNLVESGNLNNGYNLNFIVRYLTKSVLYFGLWLVFPNVALLFFIIYSAWHFGQCDIFQWQLKRNIPLKNWLWGILLLGIIIFGHISETNLILSEMRTVTILLGQKEILLLNVLMITGALVWASYEKNLSMILSILMLAISIQLPLIVAFGLYFIGQHSFNGWTHLKKGLQAGNTILYVKALPYTLGAFLLFVFLAYAMKSGWLNTLKGQELTAFFVFISCVSFPHILTMHKFYNKYST